MRFSHGCAKLYSTTANQPNREAMQQERCRCTCSVKQPPGEPQDPEPHLRCSFPTRHPSGKVGGSVGGWSGEGDAAGQWC